MRKRTVRSGLKFMLAGIICVIVASFFPAQAADILLLGVGGEVRITFLGFFLGGVCGGCGVLVTATGLVQAGGNDRSVRLFPTVAMLFTAVVLFFVLAYTSFTRPLPEAPPLQRGQSISI